MKKKIILRVEAGMGNQLFQYAFARAVSEQYGGEIIFDKRPLKKSKNFNFALSNFRLNPNVRIDNNFTVDIFIYGMRLWYKTIKIFTSIIKNKTLRKKIRVLFGLFIQETTIYEQYNYFSAFPFKYISGNWMSEKYFITVKEIIKNELTIITSFLPEIIEISKKIASQNSVCIHIRRGDYTNNEWASKLLVCDFNYYNRAINYLNRELIAPVFYIFSNTHEDIEWIKNNYLFSFPVKYIDMGNKDYEDFFLMTKCKHFVLSNSTYSWWASYLSANPNKLVVAPSKWNNGLWDMKDIYLDFWEII